MKKHTPFHYIFIIFWELGKAFVGSVFWFIVSLIGWGIFQFVRSPFDLVIGLPLLLIGAGFVIHALWSVFLSVTSPRYNRGVCVLCH